MLTGFTIGRYWQQQVSQSYSGYFDSTKTNRIFKDALIAVCEQKYIQPDTTKSRDELSFINKTNVVFSINNNQIHVAPLQLTNVSIVGTTGTFTTFLPHNLESGDTVTIASVAGFSVNPNGSFAVTVTGDSTFTTTVTATVGTYTANTGTVTYSKLISDYWHLLAIKAQFSQRIYNVSIESVSNTNPIVVTLDKYNNFRTGEKVIISGVLGTTNANGTFFIRKKNSFDFALYSDINLQTPVAGNGAYTSGGVISRTAYEYCTLYESRGKIGLLNIPTILEPAYELAEKLIKIYPLTETCDQITIDYIKNPDQLIDVDDNTIDLTLYYPEKFLYLVIDQAAKIFGEQVRDTELYAESNTDIIQNN